MESADEDIWTGVFANRVWKLKQSDEGILYQIYDTNENINESENETLLRNYFRLDLDLEEYYRNWSKADPYFQEAAMEFYGIRILSQELVENIFSFICSSNNNITR